MRRRPTLTTFAALFAPTALTLTATLAPEPGSRGPGIAVPPATAEEEEAPLAWLVGRWLGEGLGGQVEETWLPPLGGVMLGTFRLIRDGRPDFYELMTIRVDDGEPVMALKHFHPDLAGWEEKDERLLWPAHLHEEDEVGFGPVHYERLTEDSLRVTVELGEGEPSELRFRRVSL